jgi:hypothetical protein
MDMEKILKALFILTLLSVISGRAPAAEDFFKSEQDHSALLPADKVFPAGRIFPYAGFSPKSVEEIKQRKFTLAGPAYGKGIETLRKQAVEAKMPVILPLNAIYNGKVLKKEDLAAKDIDWNAITEDIARQVKEVSADRSIAWWYLTPEELRFWYPNEKKYLELAYKTIKDADPDKRPVWMYSPGHRNDEAMAKEAQFLDIIGKGVYTNYSGMKDSRVWVRWSIEQEINAIRLAGKKDAFPILVPEMFQEPAAEEKSMIPSWVRHDVYLGLVSGAKGVVIFSLWPRAKFPSYPVYYDAYCGVAAELNGSAGLGRVFLFGEPRNDIQMKITGGTATVNCKFKVKKVETLTYPAVAFANLEYGKKRYLIAVNSANSGLTAEFSGFPKGGIAVANAFSGKTADAPENGILKLEFKPYEVKGLVFAATEKQ